MNGDFTRDTYRARQHYWGVLRQQGRVDLDADWNEQVQIQRHQHVARTADLLGPTGGPAAGAGFALTAPGDGTVTIGAGRYYVEGILCENDDPTPIEAQPDLPEGPGPPAAAGLHLAVLDVRDRHVTCLDDPVVREVALGGPDTAGRARTVWQVTTSPVSIPPGMQSELTVLLSDLAAARAADDATAEQAALAAIEALVAPAACEAGLELGGSLEAGTGTLAARTDPGAVGGGDPCRFDPGGGYRRSENRLYRVEIHDPGDRGAATYTWSRDNGSVAVPVAEYLVAVGQSTTRRVRVRSLGLDEGTAFDEGDWVEVIADDDELLGRPGTLTRVAHRPDAAERILELEDPVQQKTLDRHPKVRRWDMAFDVGAATTSGTWAALEDGVEVRFGAGRFHTGDHWLIPARANTGTVEWPPLPTYPGEDVTGATPELLPPRGIEHRRAPLALLVSDGTRVVASVDRRTLHPALVDLTTLRYVGGDGQEPRLPSGELPQPLLVAVVNGDQPVAGAAVRFEVTAGGGTLETTDASGAPVTGSTVTALTDPTGLGSARWTVAPITPDHTVTAIRLDRCGDPTGPAVVFSARVNVQLHLLGGDGQSGLPGETVAPLRVWVSDGRWPVEGARVEFAPADTDSGTVTPATVTTGADGTAECHWTLGPSAYRQRVQARLLDGGVPVHDAAITFNADLSLAGHVAYTPDPTCSPLAGTDTVQEALDELCRRQTGGTCAFVVREGDDLATLRDAVRNPAFTDGSICFAEGMFTFPEPLELAGKGHVTVTGLGTATTLTCRRGETALRFVDCEGVEIRHLRVVNAEPGRGRGVGGSLEVVECGTVTIEGVTAVCGPAPEPTAAAIVVRRSSDPPREGPVRIIRCDLEVGEQQNGILIVNARHSLVEHTTVHPGASEGTPPLATFLENPRYRAKVRHKLVTFGRIATPGGRREGPTLGQVSFDIAGERLVFHSEVWEGTRPDVWREEIAARGATSLKEARLAAMAMADVVLRNAGALGGRRVFRDWFARLEAAFTPAPEAGIVIGGTVADDVRILHNTVTGALRGVVLGLSADDAVRYQAGVVQVVGNTLAPPGDSTVASHGEGVFVGNCRSLLVGDNAVVVRPTADGRPVLPVDGVRVEGQLGARLVVRANHFDGTQVGVRVKPVFVDPGAVRRWVVADNVATTGALLEAPCEVRDDGNVPSRPTPCPGDRPA